MKRRLWMSLMATILIVLAAFGGNLAADNTPKLGLDLQGGAAVILEPEGEATGEDLTIVRDLIRDELERTGIAEPNVRVQGETIVVELPGVKDQQEALDAVDVSGIVELRPVINFASCGGGDGITQLPIDGITVEPSDPNTLGLETPASLPLEGVVPDDTEGVKRRSAPEPDTVDPVVTGVPQIPGTGEVFERRSAAVDNQFGFSVNVGLNGGQGEATWNSLANQCFNGAPTCPSIQPGSNGQIAIVLDDVIQSAPSVNTTNFSGQVSITGQFTQDEAESLANILNRGAFPVRMVAQEFETISPAAGQESLRASIIAGLIGVVLVLTFLLAYYRWIALVILAGLTMWGLTVFSVAAFVSSATNYSLSLAGITGIIVAVGVTVDSYVVFFERMKDEIRNGRTLKNAAPRSFKMTWRTIWSADLVSIIGAAILFWLSVGSVRGFALFLGITTICDLFICYFFTRPAVLLLARSKFMVGKRAFGLEVVS
jgi:preprotein translocase subunit SecD